MPSKEFHLYDESDKALLVIYTDLKYSLEKIYGCKNHPENSSTKKVNEHIPLGSSMSIIISFRSIENKHNVYRGKGWMKKFCKSSTEHAMKIINSKKKKMMLLTKGQQKSNENAKICYICKDLRIWK